MSKPTPRPWYILPAGPGGRYAIVEADGTTVCSPSFMGQRNARLIANAPELLAEVARLTAIVESVELPDRSTPDTSRARALLTRLGVEV